MAGKVEISGTATWTPAQVSSGFPAQTLSQALSYLSRTWAKKTADSLDLTAVVGYALDMAGITKGRVLVLQADTSAVLYASVTTPLSVTAQKVPVDNLTIITGTQDGHEVTAVTVTGTGKMEYFMAGE